ncbi:hypothetical protein Tco_1480820, partial [Tanacetum coccineum]
PKTAEGDAKLESQWTPNEKRVVVQDHHLKSIIMSCLPDDILEFVMSCVSAKETWTDLVHSFECPSDTKENRIMDLKFEYQTLRAKSTESLSQTYTRYKTLLNELANDSVNLSKHEINTLNLADIYERFVYEDNLIQRRYFDTKKALITTPSSTPISTAFFFNNVIQDFQENSDDEVDERTSEEYLRDLILSIMKEPFWQRLNILSKYNKMVFELNKCRDELLILKQAKLNAVTFQIQNTELIKLNHALQEQLK